MDNDVEWILDGLLGDVDEKRSVKVEGVKEVGTNTIRYRHLTNKAPILCSVISSRSRALLSSSLLLYFYCALFYYVGYSR